MTRPGSGVVAPGGARGNRLAKAVDDGEHPPDVFLGRWRIVEVTGLTRGDLHWAYEPPNVTFDAHFDGSFSFGLVVGELDVRYGTRDGVESAEFTWDGADGVGVATGRGWAVLGDAPGTLEGAFFIHKGPEIQFLARRD